MFELNNFDSIQIGVASPDKIKSWSYGEVTKPETINYRTQKPEPGGLFCEAIFGPTKDWECRCGKYKRIRYKGVVCDKCGVEVTRAKVRRDRMGHIELAAPVSHIWYFKGVPSRIGIMLDMSPKALEQVLYFVNYVVIDPGKTDFQYKEVINETQYQSAVEKYGEGSFVAKMGAEAIRELLMAIDLDKEAEELRKTINEGNSTQKKLKAVKRIDIVEAFRKSGNRPEWMILTTLPVMPPELRPMVPLDGGRFTTSDLNDLYRRVINRNNRLKKLIELDAPEMIIRNEKRMLQDAVDALIDNGRKGKAVTGASNRELKSLSGLLKGKQGRFRQNLLGKRVDYSGRSVIVVGPELKLYQCGLPKEMAIELFKPFVMKELVSRQISHNVKSAKRAVEKMKPQVWDVLEDVIKDHPVLLNRAPTLHRLSIQAFEPVLIEGRAIKLHPLVCGGFNADFDGDQMAVHVPLSLEAQAEARFLMLASHNILKLSDGKPVMSPSQDMVLGAYYLTITRREEGKYYDKFFKEFTIGDDGNYLDEKGRVYEKVVDTPKGMTLQGKDKGDMCSEVNIYVPTYYISEDEATMAYQTKQLHIQDEIYLRRTVEIPGTDRKVTGIVKTTVGRIIFNNAIPQDLGFAKRNTDEDYLKYEMDELVGKKTLQKIVLNSFKTGGAEKAAEVLDSVKALGYKYSTIGALSTSVFDMHMPPEKAKILQDADAQVVNIQKKFARGLLTEQERYKNVIDVWTKATSVVSESLKQQLDKFNPIWMMADSGARGSIDQIKQLVGMRGLMSKPNGETIEVPVKSCYREGLSVLEYFISSHGGRKGLADTALKTADSGYLTRRLVDVAQDVVVREDDCFASRGEKIRGMKVSAITSNTNGTVEIIEKLEDRLIGRFTAEDVIDPATGEVIIGINQMIDEDTAKRITKAGITEVAIRSIFTCKSRYGVCAKCYGKDMSTNNSKVEVGEAVGIIAAQSIGEPGTQLTMRTFHTGGIASTGDITRGLPRVEELFEARRPKGEAIVADIEGTATIQEENKVIHIIITPENGAKKDYAVPFGQGVTVRNGDFVPLGTILTNGSAYPQEILKITGVNGVEDYLLKEVQAVYRSQGVDINDKHVEIIIRQMLKKVKVENGGDTGFLPGQVIDVNVYDEENARVVENGGRPAVAKKILLGITKATLATDSFLSAASFQETAKVLTEAAIKSKVDPLIGLNENVIIGKLIPAGTGMGEYKGLTPHYVAGRDAESDDDFTSDTVAE